MWIIKASSSGGWQPLCLYCGEKIYKENNQDHTIIDLPGHSSALMDTTLVSVIVNTALVDTTLVSVIVNTALMNTTLKLWCDPADMSTSGYIACVISNTSMIMITHARPSLSNNDNTKKFPLLYVENLLRIFSLTPFFPINLLSSPLIPGVNLSSPDSANYLFFWRDLQLWTLEDYLLQNNLHI